MSSRLEVNVILSYFQRSLFSWLIHNVVPDQTPQRTTVPGSRTSLGGSWTLLTPATFPTVCRRRRLSLGRHYQRCFLPVLALPSTETRKGTLTLQISKHNKVIMLLWSNMSKHSLKTLLLLLLMKIPNNILDLSFWESLCVISSSPHNNYCYCWSLMRWLSIPQHIKTKTHTTKSLNFNWRILLISLMFIIN